MQIIKFEDFSPEEQEVFGLVCRRGHKLRCEFVVHAEIPEPSDGLPEPGVRRVIVEHIPSSRARDMRAGEGPKWIDRFEDDLIWGFFRVRPTPES